jgi:hypothetical protein
LFGRLLQSVTQNDRKSKIPAGAKPVKLNKWIQRIRASQSIGVTFSLSRIVMRITRGADNDSNASQGSQLELATAKRFQFRGHRVHGKTLWEKKPRHNLLRIAFLPFYWNISTSVLNRLFRNIARVCECATRLP